MKIYNYNNINREKLDILLERPYVDSAQKTIQVQKIINNIRTNGDSALLELTKKIDGIELDNIAVARNKIKSAFKSLPDDVKGAFQNAINNVEKFHKSQMLIEGAVETQKGVKCRREVRAIESVGLYIPGGTAILPSTLIMLAVPAKLAGCKNIQICTPPNREGKTTDEILALAYMLGIESIFTVGGAQAIAAMAYGTQQIRKVDKIFGPGNQYVTLAKMLVSQDPKGAAIDIPAGPSEVLVIGDQSADPNFVASDLLAQAEHGEDSQVIFLSVDEVIAEKTLDCIFKQLEYLPRKNIAQKALDNSKIIIVDDLENAFEISNKYAPEHLILQIENVKKYLKLIQNAGSVFVGKRSPESVGDYASGTNHTLPTCGFAKAYSGVSLDSFIKKITFQELTEEGLLGIGDTVMKMAEVEELEAHRKAVEIRMGGII